jgi:ribonuclease BN (tRNA processing enzyme)
LFGKLSRPRPGGSRIVKIKVLGASGSEVTGHLCPAFVVDGKILLDAGTVGLSLNISEEDRIRHILLTHAHFDHIKGIPFMLDNLVTRETRTTVTLTSGREVISDLKKHFFNERIWPDFTRIPTPEDPVLRYKTIQPGRRVTIDGYRVTAERVSHTVPTYGYILEDETGTAIAYTGDTGPTDRFWKKMATFDVRCLIVETSFPNRLEEIALQSGHLTPSLLGREIEKMKPPPPQIYLMHPKPQYLQEMEKEILALGRSGIRLLNKGEVLEI